MSLLKILTLRCKESDRLLSEALDRRLTWTERAALRAHVAICRGCRRSKRQLGTLRSAMRQYTLHAEDDAPGELSAEARERINAALRDQA